MNYNFGSSGSTLQAARKPFFTIQIQYMCTVVLSLWATHSHILNATFLAPYVLPEVRSAPVHFTVLSGRWTFHNSSTILQVDTVQYGISLYAARTDINVSVHTLTVRYSGFMYELGQVSCTYVLYIPSAPLSIYCADDNATLRFRFTSLISCSTIWLTCLHPYIVRPTCSDVPQIGVQPCYCTNLYHTTVLSCGADLLR